MFSLICPWINNLVYNREAGDLRRYHAHYDVIVMNFLYTAHVPLFNLSVVGVGALHLRTAAMPYTIVIVARAVSKDK